MLDIKQQLQSIKNEYDAHFLLSEELQNNILLELANLLESSINDVIGANQQDLAIMDKLDPKYDRLELTVDRIIAIANDVRSVAKLTSPLNIILEDRVLDNKLHLQKISVPIGIVGVIYEARPNVTIDVFCLCLKSSNACVLKGGKEAYYSNKIFTKLIHQALAKYNVSECFAFLMPAGREYVFDLLHAVGIVDVCIPRGSQGLINFVRENAKIPVIETGAGIVHTYVDKSADINKASKIIENAKTRRVSVCNALDTLIIDQDILPDLARLVRDLASKQVVLYADEKSYAALIANYPQELLKPATEDSFGQEFLDYKMSIKVVASIDEAIMHIRKYSSKHSEAIVAEDKDIIAKFMQQIDAAAVYANASTAFTDGGCFGLGAEIGISTQKLHARGPMGLKELTSYKWLVHGDGQVR